MDIIIGGGITGLSYAMYNAQGEYLIIEKETELGGYCRTLRRNGFVWDFSGHFFHFQDAGIKELLMCGLESENQVVKVEKDTKIKYKDRYVDFPFQKNIHQLPKDEFIDCLVDLFDVRETESHNFKEMLYCKFGKSIAEKFLIPYNEKLYACDLNSLDKDAMGRFFPYAEKEEIIKNFRVKDNSSYNGSFVYPKNGAIEYVNNICRRLDINKFKTNASVVSIDPNKKEVVIDTGEVLAYDRLISTVPFPKLLNLCGLNYNESVYNWNQVLVFNMGFDKKGPNTTSHWIYYPDKKICFYRVGFYDNILQQDRTSLYVELGFDKNADIDPDKWLASVLHDLKEVGCITDDMRLVDYQSLIMDPAYVHITEQSQKDVKEKKALLAKYDIYSIGRYGSWTYCSIEDNIKEAKGLSDTLRLHDGEDNQYNCSNL